MKNQKQAGKMCPHRKTCIPLQEGIADCINCKIITPKKKKSGVVKSKCWITHAMTRADGMTQMVTIDSKAGKAGWIPAIITIERKHLGGNHGKR